MPEITDPVVINGYSQPGASPNTLGIGPGSLGHSLSDGDNAVLAIELDGSQAGTTASGLLVTAGNTTIEGLAIHSFSYFGIFLSANDGNTIAGNFIGTDVLGTSAAGNGQDGIAATTSNFNTIGGITPEVRNVISGNGNSGIDMQPSNGNLIEGNFIGTDATGTVALTTAAGSRSGVMIYGGNSNIIGGANANVAISSPATRAL